MRAGSYILAAVFAFAAAIASAFADDSVNDLLQGRSVAVSIKCDYGSAWNRSGQVTLKPKPNGSLSYQHPTCHEFELTNGAGRDTHRAITTARRGNEITIEDSVVQEKDVKFTTVVTIQGNSCRARQDVERGTVSFEEMDPSCRVVRCMLSAAAVAPAKKNAPRTACVTPPAGQVRRVSDTYACVHVKNTNSDTKCVYSYTYRLSNRQNPQPGGNLGPSESRESCTQQAGVGISFEKWTLVGGSAR